MAAAAAADHPDQAALHLGRELQADLESRQERKPADDDHQGPDRQDRRAMKARTATEVMVDFCMRYGNPSTESKVRAMVEAGCEKILFFPLYPHYAGATSATANDQFFRALMKEKWQPRCGRCPISTIRCISRRWRSRSNGLCRRWIRSPRCAGAQLSRDAQAVSDGGRPLSLPVRQDLAPAARTAGLGQGRSTPPSSRSSAPRNG
jgi:hypothetical protein